MIAPVLLMLAHFVLLQVDKPPAVGTGLMLLVHWVQWCCCNVAGAAVALLLLLWADHRHLFAVEPAHRLASPSARPHGLGVLISGMRVITSFVVCVGGCSVALPISATLR